MGRRSRVQDPSLDDGPAPARFIASVREGLAPLADPDRAAGQAAYLKTDEPMLGVRVPDVRRVTRAAAKTAGFTSTEQIIAATRTLWDGARNREERRAAIGLLLAPVVKQFVTPDIMDLVHHMVVTGAWWDLVDELVRVQLIVRDHDRAGEDARMRRWARDPDWVRAFVAGRPEMSALSRREATKHL